MHVVSGTDDSSPESDLMGSLQVSTTWKTCLSAGASNEEQTGILGQIYEDTEFLGGNRGKHMERQSTEQIAPYEDTEFLDRDKIGSQDGYQKGSTDAARNQKERYRAEDRTETEDFGIYQVKILEVFLKTWAPVSVNSRKYGRIMDIPYSNFCSIEWISCQPTWLPETPSWRHSECRTLNLLAKARVVILGR